MSFSSTDDQIHYNTQSNRRPVPAVLSSSQSHNIKALDDYRVQDHHSDLGIGDKPTQVQAKPQCTPKERRQHRSAAEILSMDDGVEEDSAGVQRPRNIRQESKSQLDKLYLKVRAHGRDADQVSKDIYHQHLRRQYNGHSGLKWPLRYHNPKRTISQADTQSFVQNSEFTDYGAKRQFLNPLGQTIEKYEDLDTYLSPSNSVPRRLVVQTTKDASKSSAGITWRRTSVQGTVPLALRMAEWALNPDLGSFSKMCRCALVALPLQALLALPGANAPWEMGDIEDSYADYPGYHWKWAKHAINPLDMRGDGVKAEELPVASVPYHRSRPRQLVVHSEGVWKVVEHPANNLQYIFISYHWNSFERNPPPGLRGDRKVHMMAQYMAYEAGVSAYYLDEDCNASITEPDLLTKDINTMCDAIRGSRCVALLLPDDQIDRKVAWGHRLWTVPEGLLAPGEIRICTWRGPSNYDVRQMSKVELTSQFWSDGYEIRTLAEHFQGLNALSPLGLFSNAITALSNRSTSNDHTGADLAYALMGLLNFKIDPDPSDDLFQVIARLSFANENDHLIERMVSAFPKPTQNIRELFKLLAERDQYETHIWDITPRCQVVGVGDEPNTVILNECRAVPIRWKRFPRMMYQRHVGYKKKIAEMFVRSGAWWMVSGYTLAFTYAPILLGIGSEHLFNPNWFWRAIVFFCGIGLFLSAFAPACVRRLFGGEVLKSAPHLVAFEGVMPKHNLEKIIFGTNRGRLTYEPCSTPFGRECKHRYLRIGKEPPWVTEGRPQDASGLLPDHRLFTLIDTGNLSISIFQARRPPTVAVITGAEGGMLRAALCSWRFADDTLYRETVIRVPSSTWSQTKPAAWLKMSLQSQNDLFDTKPPGLLEPSASTARKGVKEKLHL